MKSSLILSIILFFLLIDFSCCEKKIDDKEKSRLILSSRNLGLAYLEENKLPEAETEFLKLIKLAPKEAIGFANLGLVYLRLGKTEDAEKQIKKGLEIDSGNPDIRLILATLYDITDRDEQSIEELHNVLKNSPGNIKALFALTDIYSKRSEAGSSAKREDYLRDIVKSAPTNLVGRLYLIDVLFENAKYDEALGQLEEIKREFPEFPGESNNFYRKAVELLKAGKGKDAITPARIFHNFLKLTPAYQAAVLELKGPRGDLIGFPLITMGEVVSNYVNQGGSILDAIKFTDVSQSAGLSIQNQGVGKVNNLSVGDIDNDGDQDIFICNINEGKGNKSGMLLRNDMGTYSDISENSGINLNATGNSSIFADFDNDGFLDLFINTEKGIILFHNDGNGKFSDVTKKAALPAEIVSNFALFFDYDHDGDLDFFTGGETQNQLFRNNSDGSFLEQSNEAGMGEKNLGTKDADYGDFDDDGDIDLLIANKNSGNILYSNLREGKFDNDSEKAGIDTQEGSTKLAVGDYNNDGYLDVFIVANNGFELLRNRKDGTFEKDNDASRLVLKLNEIKGKDAQFLDFDNDGSLDLLVGGESIKQGGRGVWLFHNDGWGKFVDMSKLLPDNIRSAKSFSIADFNEDGDPDIYLIDTTGELHLLRNDGGNANHYIKIQLVGIRTGSSKNNYFGIGSKLEVRAGDLYQMRLITHPDVIIGIGDRTKADVVRIQWTNGTSQNIFAPESDQGLVEQQELKGSCPFLYSWNGHEFVFVKDMLWRSALGMPMGIMKGSRTFAFPDAAVEYIKLPGAMLQPKKNFYEIQMTSELWETIYTDKINLVAIDHPVNIEIYVDEKFTPPPFKPLRIYAVDKKYIPLSASDKMGNDVLPMIRDKDDKYVSTFEAGKYQGITEMSELTLDPGQIDLRDSTFLFLNGWIFPTDASINFALSQSDANGSKPPCLQVRDNHGNWVTVIENIGFPMGKDKTVIVDITGKIKSPDHRVKIITNMQIYWDYIFFAHTVKSTVRINVLQPEYADLHYRGFSKMFRKGGRYGPHWFDYNNLNTSPKYSDLEGFYTRYGDVLPLLLYPDDQYIISNSGDEITVRFNNSGLPESSPGVMRDFLVYSEGWVKDGDLNTASGNTVIPLPFHAMSKYPYGADESYPSDPEHKKYQMEYNTRYIDSYKFKRALAENGNNH